MSERKTAEIKFRITPSEKAAWQRYAEEAQLGLSELIRREVNAEIRSEERNPEPARVPYDAVDNNGNYVWHERWKAQQSSPATFVNDTVTFQFLVKPWMFEAKDG